VSNLDEALERFHLSDLEYAGGYANHGPMGAEALESVGHQALIPAFLDLYAPRLPPATPGAALDPSELAAARGESTRRSDWVATFEARLTQGDWRALLREVLPGLIGGLFASAGHGLLRCAHAVRSLEREDNPLRRRELARALAAWEARYQSLPGVPGSRSSSPGSAGELAGFFASLPLLGEASSREGLFFEIARRLDDFAPFAEAIDAAPVPTTNAALDEWLSALVRVGATLYLAHPEARIAYVHGVTLPAAWRVLVPLLDDETALRGAAAVLQCVAALHSLFGERGEGDEAPEPDAEVAATAESWDEIRYRAACSLEEHAIKMVEACWREDHPTSDGVLRLAAADAALRLEPRKGTWGC
jgi:hypothetical protein